MLAIARGIWHSRLQRLKDMEIQPEKHKSICREEKSKPSEICEETDTKDTCPPALGDKALRAASAALSTH